MRGGGGQVEVAGTHTQVESIPGLEYHGEFFFSFFNFQFSISEMDFVCCCYGYGYRFIIN